MGTGITEDWNEKISEFYNDENFNKIKQFYERTTVFDILKLQRWEIRHSAFLCWLLDINGSHALGEKPIRKLLRLAATKMTVTNDVPDGLKDSFIVGNYKLTDFSNKTEETVEGGSIDIYAEFKIADYEIALIIENKVYSDEHDGQTSNYYKAIEKKNKTIFAIYLTPKRAQCDCDKYVLLNYQDILEYVIEPLQFEPMPEKTAMLIKDYIVNLGKPASLSMEEGTTDEKPLEDILATTKENQELLRGLFNKYRQFLLVALDSQEKQLKDFMSSNYLYMQLLFNNYLNSGEKINDDVREKIKKFLKISNKRVSFTLDGKIVKGKNTLVLEIVKQYVEHNPAVSASGLKKLFNEKSLLRGGQVITLKSDAEKDSANLDDNGCNYFIDENDVLKLPRGEEVVVWRYWPDTFFEPFLKKVKEELGYKIEEL